MFCPNCGTEILPNANFCEKCGINLKEALHPNVLKPVSSSINRTLPSIRIGGIRPHPDVIPLLWFADGKFRNFDAKQSAFRDEFKSKYVSFTMYGVEEPSALYSKLPIRKTTHKVERPPYYPSYTSLSPEQRYMYLSFLADPYGSHDIGYVFIFYYGLERHLLLGNFDDSFDIILKLRDVHSNASFQSYSADALVLTSIMRNRLDKFNDFLLSLDKPYELDIMPNLYLLMKESVNESLTAAEIMHFSTSFGFTNKRYIKSNPSLFEDYLQNAIQELEHKNRLNIPKLKPSKLTVPLFANYSLRDVLVSVPDYFSSKQFVGKGYMLLTTAHNMCKQELAKQRKKS